MSRTTALAALIGCTLFASAHAADPPVVRVIRNVTYLPGASYPANEDKLDLYLPEGRRSVPVIVSVHGGGLMRGDKNGDVYIGLRFATAGFATAIVNHRLSPAVAHPAHVQDVASAFAWLKRHVSKYGGNPDQMFLVGHSSGAYLAALLATDERYLAAHGLSLEDIRGVVPVSGFYWVEESGVAPTRDKSLWGGDRNAWIDASPANHLHAALPPVLVLYADGDDWWRREQNIAFATALKAAGNAHVDIAEISRRTHDTIWSRLAQDGDETAGRIIDFVRALAPPQPSAVLRRSRPRPR